MEEQVPRLGPSSLYRWANCPASPWLAMRLARKDSVFSTEGTLYHAVGEFCWQRTLHRVSDAAAVTQEEQLRKKCAAHNVDVADAFAVATVWQNAVRALHQAYWTDPSWLEIHAELPLWMPELGPDVKGTADLVAWYTGPSGVSSLLISDLKAGVGVPVHARGNTQLMLYAFSALQRRSLLYDDVTADTPVTLQIAQARLANGISNWTVDASYIANWVATYVQPAVQRVYENRDKVVPGSWCQFCRVSGQCSAQAALAAHALTRRRLMDQGRVLEVEELAEWLELLPALRAFIKDLNEVAMEASLAGTEIPGWRLSEGRGQRRVVDVPGALDRLTAAGYSMDQVAEPKLKTLATLDRLAGGADALAELLGDSLGRTPGKLALKPATDPADIDRMFSEQTDITI